MTIIAMPVRSHEGRKLTKLYGQGVVEASMADCRLLSRRDGDVDEDSVFWVCDSRAARWLEIARIASPRIVCYCSDSNCVLVYTPSRLGSSTPWLIMWEKLKV